MTWSVALAAGGAIAATATSPINYSWTGVVGRLHVLVVGRDAATATNVAVTDSGGNTWTQAHYAPTSGSTGRHIEHWYCVPTSSFTSVTLTFSGSPTTGAVPLEITGQASPLAIDAQAAAAASASTAPAQVTVTPTVADTLEVAAIQWNANNHSTQVNAEAGWTKLATVSGGPAVAYRIAASVGVADGCAWTTTGSSLGSAASLVAYEPGDALPPSSPGITLWNGTAEVAVTTITVWDGTVEVPATLDTIG